MWLRECYIILVVSTAIYAASIPQNVANEISDDVKPITKRPTKDIQVFEEEGANNVEENFEGLPEELRPNNSGSPGSFPTFPGNDVQPTSQQGNPPVSQAPEKPSTSVTTPHQNHHPFLFKPRLVEFIEKLREAAAETAKENQERIQRKVQVIADFYASLMKASRETIDTGILLGNTIPRFGDKLYEKLSVFRNTGKTVDEFTP